MDIRPQPGPQEKFLSSRADIAIYGGAAGGGKTWALLLDPVRNVRLRGFTGVIFRRIKEEIRYPGGLWDESQKVYPYLGGKPREAQLEWRFGNDSKLKFAALRGENDVQNWKGSQLAFVGFDELTAFSENQFFYLLSRLRTTCGARTSLRATTNPDATSWVRHLIDWWIGDDGLPIPERSGVLRYFARRSNEILWATDPRELLDQFPDLSKTDLKSLTFVSASIFDNRKLLDANPEYLGNLKSLPLVDRERLLGGNWKTIVEGNFFRRGWFPIVKALPTCTNWVRAWDLAASKPKPGRKDPDWTVGCLMGRHSGGFVVADIQRIRDTPGEVKKLIKVTASADKARFGSVLTLIEQEGGSSGVYVSDDLVRELAGYWVAVEPPQSSKQERSKPLSSQAEAGNVQLLESHWNHEFLNELAGFPNPKIHDDQVDATSLAFSKCSLFGQSFGR